MKKNLLAGLIASLFVSGAFAFEPFTAVSYTHLDVYKRQVHEYGHYLVARWVGVKVLRFSVGFGRALWSKRIGRDGTEWALGMCP